MPKVSTQVYMLDRKIWKLFRPRGNGRKRTKCDQFFCPTSDFFDFCNPYFFYHTFTNDVILLTKPCPMQKSVTTVCLHCSFARLKNKHIGVLGTNVATISWLHWSPVSTDSCTKKISWRTNMKTLINIRYLLKALQDRTSERSISKICQDRLEKCDFRSEKFPATWNHGKIYDNLWTDVVTS